MTCKKQVVDILRSIIQEVQVYPQFTFEIYPLKTHPRQPIVPDVQNRKFLGILDSLGQLKTAKGDGFRVVQRFSGLENVVNSCFDDDNHQLKIKINSKHINSNRMCFIGIMSGRLKRGKDMNSEHRVMLREFGRKYIGSL